MKLLQHDVAFEFTAECVKALDTPKKAVITTTVIAALDWQKSFEVMCDASDYVVGVMLGP